MPLSDKSKKTRSRSRSKSKGRRGRGRGRGRGRRGRARGKGSRRGSSKKKSYDVERPRKSSFRKPPYKKKRSGAPAKKSRGTAVINITNLDHAVTEADVREIFSKIGKVKKAIVHYNAQGKSRGTAIVIFANPASAIKAVTEYHQAEVDGKPMYVKAVTYSSKPALTPMKKKPTKKKKSTKKKMPMKKKNSTKKRSTREPGRGGRGKKVSKRKKFKVQPSKTVEQLDQEMEDYYNKGSITSTVDLISAGQPDIAKLYSSDAAEE